MRPENMRMKEFLKQHGIEAQPKYIFHGSLHHSWRLYNHDIKWSAQLQRKLTDLGFTGLHGPLTQYSGNGGVFSVFVRGHNELLESLSA
jgi:hypothetical protein